MFCDDCKIKIPYLTDTCPLCEKKVSDTNELDNPLYPRRNASFKFPVKYSFSMFYGIIAFSIFIIMLVVNLITSKHLLWAFIVGAGLIYLFVLVRHTILTSYGSAGKIFMQGLIICILLWVIQWVTRSGTWAYDYVIPMVLVINTIVQWALAFIRRIRRANYAFTLLGMSILNIAPLLWYLMGLSTVLWTMIMSLSTAGLTLIMCMILFRRLVYEEIKRLMHI